MVNIRREYTSAKVILSQDGLSEVISEIYCNIVGTDDVGHQLSSGKFFVCDAPDPSIFISFENITSDLLDWWITGTEDYNKLEQEVLDGLSSLFTPSLEIRALDL